MRIGIITIQKCDNFGSDLQAFALQRKLQMLGYEVENIDYLFYKSRRHKKTRMSRPTFHVSLKNKIKEFLYPKKALLLKLFKWKESLNRQKKFDAFVRDNIRLSREYRTIDDLFDNPPIYDAYVVGSDELWNTRCNSSMLPFFLDFAPKGSLRMSYAASTGGHDKYDEETKGVFRQCLASFSSISMRERSSCEYFSKMLGRDVVNVVDPTLLLSADEWRKVMSPMPVKEPYVVVYDLIPSSQVWSMAHRIAEQSGMRIVRICGSVGMRKFPNVVQYSEIGPAEFITIISRASGVITNSFHGVVFSILFQKPFYFVVPGHMTDSGRVGSLLQSLGLDERMLWEKDANQIKALSQIEFAGPLRKLSDMRRVSVEFLMQSLQNVEK